MKATELKKRVGTRARTFASDPELVTDEVLTLAANEALELAGEESPEPVVVDIAFYRLRLQMGIDIDEREQKAYRTALSQITDPQAPNATVTPVSRQRANAYQ